MHCFDYTVINGNNVRGKRHRPTARQIVSDWKKAGRPGLFSVTYGETHAEFELVANGPWSGPSRWYDSGNGCRGVDRNAVVKALTEACARSRE
jgi:hypothetical protein